MLAARHRERCVRNDLPESVGPSVGLAERDQIDNKVISTYYRATSADSVSASCWTIAVSCDPRNAPIAGRGPLER